MPGKAEYGKFNIGWLQLATKEHKQGMRLECIHCGSCEYFGDSPSGDLELYEARKNHDCEDTRS